MERSKQAKRLAKKKEAKSKRATRDAKLAATITETKVDEKNIDDVSSENDSEATERVYRWE